MCNPYTFDVDTTVRVFSMPDRSDQHDDPEAPSCSWCAGNLDHCSDFDGEYCSECASVLRLTPALAPVDLTGLDASLAWFDTVIADYCTQGERRP